MSLTILYHAAVAGGLEARDLQALAERLPYGKRVSLPVRREDRAASLVGLALALHAARALRGRSYAPERLRFEAGGRPHLPEGPGFSIAHSGAHVVVAACEEGNIGVDVELPAESRLGEPTLREWSAREAVVKALGLGLPAAPRVVIEGGIARIDGRLLFLRPLRLDHGCLGYLASELPDATPMAEPIDAAGAVRAALAA